MDEHIKACLLDVLNATKEVASFFEGRPLVMRHIPALQNDVEEILERTFGGAS